MADEVEVRRGGVPNAGAVVRVGDDVLRPAPSNRATIHRFLRHVGRSRAALAPEPLSVDGGRERLRFIPGDVPIPPFPEWAQSDDALASIAKLIRALHDAGVESACTVSSPPAPSTLRRDRSACIRSALRAIYACSVWSVRNCPTTVDRRWWFVVGDEVPETQYTSVGDDRVAFQMFGEGNIDFAQPDGCEPHAEISTPRDRIGCVQNVGRMEYRAATPHDIEAIAALHADSWRRNYRGAYLDSYLDGDVLTDRIAVWTTRLERPSPDQFTIVAEHDALLAGFAHTLLDDDPTWGALLDNLHVAHGLERQGTGSHLMSETARVLLERRPSTGLYLWVLEQNTRAQAFYTSRGGRAVERARRGPFPGGGTAISLRFAWPEPARLLVAH